MGVLLETKSRWTGRHSICLGLAALAAINVIMCLWVAATFMSTARRQATALFSAVENASMIEFNLTMQPTTSSASVINVFGHLQPRRSTCSQRLYFDGRMTVMTVNASEVVVLMNHQKIRHPRNASSVDATCLTSRDIAPLHTLADIVHSAFHPLVCGAFAVDCRPLQYTFYDAPYVVCAEEWLRANSHPQQSITPTSNDKRLTYEPDPVLVIYGKKSTMRLVMLNYTESSGIPFKLLDRCEYLDAPMTSGEFCSNRTFPCPSPRTFTCTKH